MGMEGSLGTVLCQQRGMTAKYTVHRYLTIQHFGSFSTSLAYMCFSNVLIARYSSSSLTQLTAKTAATSQSLEQQCYNIFTRSKNQPTM